MIEAWKKLVDGGEAVVDFIDNLYDVVAQIALYITLVVAAALIVYHLVVGKRGEEAVAKARRFELGVIVGYSVGIISTLGVLKLVGKILDGKTTTRFWLMIGFAALVLVGVVATVIMKKRNFGFTKWVVLGYSVLAIAYLVVVLVCFPAAKEDYKPLNQTLMYILSAVLVAIIAALALLLDKHEEYDSRSITYAAICIAASFALSYVKFFSLPQGGSITFASMLPLMMYAYMFGLRRGVIAGMVYGMLQFVQSPQFYEPMQALLDYPIAFAGIGLAGIGRKMKFLKGNMTAEFCVGAVIAVLFRYAAHVLSGYFVFYSWAIYWSEWYGAHPLAYSFAYNAFLFVELAVLLVVGALVFQSKSVKRMIAEVSAPQEATAEVQA